LILSGIQLSPMQDISLDNTSASSIMDVTDWSNPNSYESLLGIDPTSNPGEIKLIFETNLIVGDADNWRIVRTQIDGSGWTTLGTRGDGTGQFKRPAGVSCDSITGDIYNVDIINSRVVKTKIDGSGWQTLEGFEQPIDIDRDAATGFLYVVDAFSNQIVKTKLNGDGWTTYGSLGSGVGQFDLPRGIHYDTNSGYIYVADTYNHRIVKTMMDGTGWTTLGTEGSGVGQFDDPMGVFYDNASDYLYISDYGNSRIVKTKMDGTGWMSFGTLGSGIGQFYCPDGIYYDSKTDYIYIADDGAPRIVRTKIDGTGWMTLGSLGPGVGQFSQPIGIAIDKSYSFYGYLNSSAFDCEYPSSFSKLNWNGDIYSGTSIKFQLRTASTEAGLILNNFIGPDGTANTYYTTSGGNIWTGHNGDQWMQYKVMLSTTERTISPKISAVSVTYNNHPAAPILISPDENWTNDNTPTFTWNFSDADTESQGSYQWQVDNHQDFTSINSESGIISTTISSHTIDSPLKDGTWYWRVKVKDSENDWSPYCDPKILKIDTVPPEPFTSTVDPNGWTSNSQPVLSFSSTDKASGISHNDIKIDGGEFSTQTSPYRIPSQQDGEHEIIVRANDYAGNFQESIVGIYIDTTNPKDLQLNLDATGWSNDSSPVLTFSAIDEISDIDYYKVSFDNQDYDEQTSTFNIPTLDDGIHNITVRAYDLAGNFAKNSIDSFIDATPPDEFKIHGSVNEWTSNNQPRIEFDTTDSTSGINNYSIQIDEDPLTTQISPYTLPQQSEGLHSLTVRAYDRADNYIDMKTDIMIDTSPPEITHVPITSGKIGDVIVINATIEDSLSGISQSIVYYKKEGKSQYYSLLMEPQKNGYYVMIPTEGFDSSIEYYIKVIDNANPPNVQYYDKNGETDIEPNPEENIKIILSTEGSDTINDPLTDQEKQLL